MFRSVARNRPGGAKGDGVASRVTQGLLRPPARPALDRPGEWADMGSHGNDAPMETLVLRRKCSGCAEEDEQKIRRRVGPGPEPGGATPGRAGAADFSGVRPSPGLAGLHGYLERSAGGGRPLEAPVRNSFERSFGRSLAGVRVVADDGAARAATALGARAFTVGQTIWLGQGEYRPEAREGRHLLAHELAHTVQQGASGTASFQRRLRVGRADDPAEAAADRAADAAVAGERVEIGRGPTGLLQRQPVGACTARAGDEPTQRIVVCGGEQHRVSLRTEEARGPATRGDANLGMGNGAVYLRVRICRGGTLVIVQPEVGNLPAIVRGILGNVLSRSAPFAGVRIEPGLTIHVVGSGTYEVTARGQVRIDAQTGRVTGGSAGVDVTTGAGGVGGSVSVDVPTGGVSFNLTFTPDARPPQTSDCDEVRHRAVLHCERLDRTPPPNPSAPRREGRTIYLLFEYATAREIGVRMAGDGGVPSPEVNPGAAADDVRRLVAQGFSAVSITGYTSPEGPEQRETRGFQGNQPLSDDRAARALAWWQSFGGRGSPSPTGASERPFMPALRGPPLERATRDFFPTDRLGPASPSERNAYARATPTQQLSDAYHALRRAEIRVERPIVPRPDQVQLSGPQYIGEACPPAVIDAARRAFGINELTGGP